FVRKGTPADAKRKPSYTQAFNIVTRLDEVKPLAGLANRNIALWNSHGLYYNRNSERWEWQRPKMFGTVEDLFTTSIVIPYLIPMLENAGAEVFMPRERDINHNEVTLIKETFDKALRFSAAVPEAGDYWVKIKYKKQKGGALSLNVKHGGVDSKYRINTSAGYGTWIYVDKLYFDDKAELVFTADKDTKLLVDSVVIGGGMSHFGSGYPRYMEAAFYNLTECGLPDSIVYNQKKGVVSDYYDDIYSRSKWVNFLMGGSDRYPSYPGLEIPIDLSFALHSDAFIRDSNRVVGTLLVCTTDSIYPSDYRRMAANDYAYYVGSQIINDFKADGLENWQWRGIWHQNYVETRVPMVPAVICETLSHQNFSDMKIGVEPRYKFIMARAIYKAMLKFLAYQHNETCVVQPLPVNSFSALFAGADSITLNWKPTIDNLEETSYPNSYIVYTRKNGRSFDSGVVVKGTSVTLPIMQDTIYSYKVVAANQGGRSFPSEILSACSVKNSDKKALVVNCFDRVSGPGSFDFGSVAGFAYEKDFGVPYLYDVAYTGPQIEYERCAPFMNNDYPGFGASLGNYETQTIVGNTFDYPYIHGIALKASGYSFVSCSKAAFSDRKTKPADYSLLDLIFGLQRNVGKFELFSNRLQSAILDYTRAGGNILLSGAFIGHEGGSFAEKTFSYIFRSPFAATDGLVSIPDSKDTYALQMMPSDKRYFLQNVDAIDPKYRGTKKLLFYNQNRLPAALLYEKNYKSIVVGFPLEALQTQDMVNKVVGLLLSYF
ncbi:MAG: hypothetical protein J6P34_05020, partial [Paludibacteraceae bacterium]|nr:hypothetical protein [Paludibacteraceae bacterium]